MHVCASKCFSHWSLQAQSKPAQRTGVACRRFTELHAHSWHHSRSIDHSFPFYSKRRLHLRPRLSGAVLMGVKSSVWYAAVSRYDMHAGQLWLQVGGDGVGSVWNTSPITYSSQIITERKATRTSVLFSALLSRTVKLQSKVDNATSTTVHVPAGGNLTNASQVLEWLNRISYWRFIYILYSGVLT